MRTTPHHFWVVPENNVVYMLAPGNSRVVYTSGDTGEELKGNTVKNNLQIVPLLGKVIFGRKKKMEEYGKPGLQLH